MISCVPSLHLPVKLYQKIVAKDVHFSCFDTSFSNFVIKRTLPCHLTHFTPVITV